MSASCSAALGAWGPTGPRKTAFQPVITSTLFDPSTPLRPKMIIEEARDLEVDKYMDCSEFETSAPVEATASTQWAQFL